MSKYMPISLPSRCIPYPNISDGDITVRPYQVKDEKVLAQINPVNLEKKYLQVLKEIVQGIDPKKLTTGDRLYIILWEYINSYSETLGVKSVCSNCFKEYNAQVNLNNLEYTYLPKDFKCPYPVELSDCTVALRPVTVEDEIETERYDDAGNDDAYEYRYARTIVEDKPLQEKIKFFSELSAKDRLKIRAFHEKYYHGPDFRAKVNCTKCGGEEEVDVPFRLDFFYPSGEALTDTFGEGL